MDFTILAFCHPYCLEGKCNMHMSEIWHSKKNDCRLSRTQVYTFPKAWIQNLKLNNARVYCTLNNIATITGYSGYDPEVSAEGGALTPGIDNSSYPRSKSWVVGVNLTF